MEASLLLPIWRSGDAASLPLLLAEDATFSSPVTEYHGRAEAAHMLGLIPRVLKDVEQTGQREAERETVSAFAARVHGDPVQGVLRERRDETGRLVHVTLFVRPYRTLGNAIEWMRELPAQSPLPSTAR